MGAMRRRVGAFARCSVSATAVLLAFACEKSTIAAPMPSLVGTWNIVGYSAGTLAATSASGTWIFGSGGTWNLNAVLLVPGLPVDSLTEQGTYVQNANHVAITYSAGTFDWLVTVSGADVTLTEDAPVANTFVLQRSP